MGRPTQSIPTRKGFSETSDDGGAMYPPAILIVDDDLGTRETFGAALNAAGYAVHVAASGAEALSCLRDLRFDAAVIDLRLPDRSGVDVARVLLEEDRTCPFIVISGFLTTVETVEVMRLGAYDVIDKPVAIADLCTALTGALETARASRRAAVRAAAGAGHPFQATSHSSAERWASVVLKACDADSDPKTLNEWARVAGLSYTSLRELCRMLDIRAHDARDLARMLRAVVKARQHHCSPKVFLDAGDERTIRLLFHRAGLEFSQPGIAVDDWLRRQRFVSFEHQAIQRLRTMLSEVASTQ
jgi:DNA-binding response OmpR family regulator